MRGVSVGLILLCCAWTPLASPAQPSHKERLLDTRFDANIAAQDVSTAVIALSKQARVQVMMPSDKLDGFDTAGVHGRMSLREALTQLLRATPYRFEQSGDSTIIIDAPEGVEAAR